MKDRKLNSRDWERMAAYAEGYFCGKNGYELQVPWHHEDPDFKYVVRGFMDGHEMFCLYGHDDFEYVPYNFDVPEDEDGKYVHINTGE